MSFMQQNLKKTPSFMDKDMLKNSSQTYSHSPGSEINFEEYIKNLDELVNSKVAQGFQMMISKIVVLIEEQVKFRVTDEVQDQLGKMMLKDFKSRLMQASNEKAKS